MPDEMTNDASQSKGKSKFKTLILFGGALLLEAGVILGAVMLFAAPPENTQADEALAMGGVPVEDRIQEVLIVDTRLPNRKTGVTYLYNTEIYAQVKSRYAERVQTELDQFQNEIRAEIAAIWRTSEPHHFQEPRLENLTRKVYALLNERFGTDPETGEPIISKAVIVMGTGFRIDS